LNVVSDIHYGFGVFTLFAENLDILALIPHMSGKAGNEDSLGCKLCEILRFQGKSDTSGERNDGE